MAVYPREVNKRKYLGFSTLEAVKVDIVLQERTAAWLRDHNLIAMGCIGYRPTSTQARLYKAWIAYLNYHNQPTKYPPVPKANPAAPPGQSWHEFGGAIDLNGRELQSFIVKYILPFDRNHQPCNDWGIAFPMNQIDAPTQLEWWHVVLLESANYKGDRSQFIFPIETVSPQPPILDANHPIVLGTTVWIHEFTRLTGRVYNLIHVKHWQATNGLEADGIVGPLSWRKAYSKFKV